MLLRLYYALVMVLVFGICYAVCGTDCAVRIRQRHGLPTRMVDFYSSPFAGMRSSYACRWAVGGTEIAYGPYAIEPCAVLRYRVLCA
eukprot:3015756-Rhodomonas_salina.1